MLCQECQKRPATVHYTKIVNGQKSEMHLCEQCAGSVNDFVFPLGLDNTFSLNQILAGLMEMDPTGDKAIRQTGPARCPNCGLTYAQFRQSGRLGCGECYQAFGGQLLPLLKRIHGSAEHTGKIPERSGSAAQNRRRLEQLRADLNRAVAREEFEHAAELRDQIRKLELQQDGQGERGNGN
ncbi:MAG: UvrB/UvrC motif-containing protein [Bacillota bacterium]